MTEKPPFDLGPVRKWREGLILFAENNLMRAAYVVSEDPRQVGTVGWFHQDEDDAIWVEYVSPDHAKHWQ